jgi:predicted enzyme related to lactoylglutathione lyase
MSTDPEASRAFFEGLFGWTARVSEPGGEQSRHLRLEQGDRTVAALISLDPVHGAPSHFVPYFAVGDVDAVCQAAEVSGGSVCHGPMDLGSAGRWALINDPGGGLFTAWCGTEPYPDPPAPERSEGLFGWEQLLAVDAVRASSFYAETLGWSVREVHMGGSPYFLFDAGPIEVAGCLPRPPGTPGPSSWLSYVSVADVDGCAARATELGGAIHVAPSDIPGVGRFAVLAEPTGAMFAVFRPTAG